MTTLENKILDLGRVVLVASVILGFSDSCIAQTFSSLSQHQQEALRQMVEPPELAERRGPYSTPMYYLMHRGYEYEGDLDFKQEDRTYDKTKPGPDYGSWVLDRNRPDWQEAMIKDWAALGLNNTHLNIYPVNDSFVLDDDYVQSLRDYVSLSQKYGLKVGVRLDAIGGYASWPVHPGNPDNVIDEYLVYVHQIAELLKGQTAYYVLGDELYLDEPYEKGRPETTWTPEDYVGYFKRVSETIKSVDPEAIVSMYGAESGKWRDVLKLIEMGYAELGDGVALNHYSYKTAIELYDQVRAVAPQMKFYSNGVGYCSTATAQPRFPEGDPYSAHPTEEAHAASVAKQVFGWWDVGADTVPYYITLRNWEIRGRVYPRWFGFFGIQDFVVGEDDKMTVRHYPGWYAYQTIAQTFYNRDELTEPDFTVETDEEVDFQRAYVRKFKGGRELLLVIWHDTGAIDTTLTLNTDTFKHPVSISLFDYQDWADLPHDTEDSTVRIPLSLSGKPTIIRLFEINNQ
jgi:hypothetical protein